MPNITDLITAISNDVVARLAAASYPALTDGRILVGRQRQFEQSAPPRIIFTPMRSSFTPKDVYSRSNVVGAPSTETRAQWAQRSILTENISFEVRCWGTATPPDPDQDFDLTQALYQAVILSVHELAVGSYKVENGQWTDGSFNSPQLIRYGREFVFSLTFMTPVLDQLLPYAPGDVHPDASDQLVLPTGEAEAGCEDDT